MKGKGFCESCGCPGEEKDVEIDKTIYRVWTFPRHYEGCRAGELVDMVNLKIIGHTIVEWVAQEQQ